ncbi:ABC transporter ATP-binding protein [Marinospirillum perlucidum]|uniref:ABC transporter ATP-binding protein n=1 Tax=Marinospirillum perlucidum TaxID=1982602 RepID=UPI000DF4C26A|nr:ABC transporter ATP-binding protein [Marinospirillum perlucidum]
MFRFFEKLTNPLPEVTVEQPPKTLLAFFRHYTRGFEKALLCLGLLTFVVAGIEVALFNFLGDLVDWVGHYAPSDLLAEKAGVFWTMGLLVGVVLPLAVIGHSLLFHQSLFVNYSMAIRWRAHLYLLQQSFSFYQDEVAGRLGNRVMQTSESLREAVMKLLDVLLYVLVYLGGMLGLILASDWMLSLPLLFWAGCYGLLLRSQIPPLRREAANQAAAQASMMGQLVDSYSHFLTVKLFSHSSREAEHSRLSMEEFLQAVYPLMRRVTRLNLSLWMLNIVLILVTASLSIYLWANNQVTAGAITIAVALTLRLKSLSQFIMWEIAGLFRNLGNVEDGIATLARPTEVQDQPQAKKLEFHQGKIEFDDIHFAYPGQPELFQGLSLTVKPGEKVGLVGSSGAGKTTLISLLLRFYDLDAGQIRVDGQSLGDLAQESLRAHIGMVSQDAGLLNRNVRDNLLYGRPDATEEELLRATRQAHADEFIEGLRDPEGREGYFAHIGEKGVKLSGGQRQRLALARVLLKDAPILILDEATSALDSEVEAAIQENLQQLMAGKTVIAIAHRLSTLTAMDRLLVLEGGQLVEQGAPADLLARKGRFAQLWARQSGGFIRD